MVLVLPMLFSVLCVGAVGVCARVVVGVDV